MLNNLLLFKSLPLEFIELHAAENKHKEICGVWTVDGEIEFFYNFADDTSNNFTFTPSVWDKLEKDNGKIVKGIFHSHPNLNHGNVLSFPDIEMSKNTGLDIASFCLPTNQWDYYSPTFPHPYPLDVIKLQESQVENLTFEQWFSNHIYFLNRSDCYSIVRDFYQLCLGIELKDFTRSTEDYYKTSTWNRFRKEFRGCGFVEYARQLNDLQTGDLLLLNLEHSKYPNHLGIFLQTDRGDCILHQPGGNRKSEIISIRSVKGLISMVLRHKDTNYVALSNCFEKPVSVD